MQIKEDGIQYNDDGKIIDILSGRELEDRPEERVRQTYINILCVDYGYPKDCMLREVPIQSGSGVMKDSQSAEIRADIVVYNSKKAARSKDQGNILFVVECKQQEEKNGYAQLVSYIYNTSAQGGVWTNGKDVAVYRKRTEDGGGLTQILSLPRHKEKWGGDRIIPDKGSLPRPHNVRFLLSSCHNKLYGRGMENKDFDLTMDMVRILLAKIQDETSLGDFPEFWITEKDFETAEGRHAAAETVQKLFRSYADQYPDVFDEHEKIQVGDDCIAEVVGILKDWRLASEYDDADDWDLMGEAYEQFTHVNLKREQGQFFTNRLVVNMMVRMLDPEVGEHALDPAGGSGGFATAIFRYLRRKVLDGTEGRPAARDKNLSIIKNSVYLVEIAPYLVKIAKCAMLLTGDGQSCMTRGNSLGSYDSMDQCIRTKCCKGKENAPSVIATNPPFAGQKSVAKISDRSILRNFAFGHSFVETASGGYEFNSREEDILPSQSPELLFLERCLDWLKPGGRLGIVMPKGFLDAVKYEPYRFWLFERYELDAVIVLHKDTFQPDTGVRTCVLFISKPKEGESPRDDYSIFMAQSQRIGQDSKGNPVFILDGKGSSTGELSQDLDEIADAYAEFKDGGKLEESDCIFSISRRDIKDHLNINPQHYSPKLNGALSLVLDLNERNGWSTTTVGQLESGIRIYIGPRWNASNLVVENPADTSCLTPFLTASSLLEARRNKIKWLDRSKANRGQERSMEMLKVKEGDILITRSGSVGYIAYATKDIAENYLVSDDLIRIRVKDETLRAYLVAYFASDTARALMLMNEYGSVQQHLQPRHIQEMAIPVPDDWDQAKDMIHAGQEFIRAMESMSLADKAVKEQGFDAVMRENQ